MDSVKAYKKRRAVRMKARMDAKEDKGRWVTTENDHKIHFNEGGEPDMGNPHVIAVMKGGGKKTKPEKDVDRFHNEVESWKDVDFPKDESEAVSVEDYQKKKMKEKLDRFSHLMHDEDPESSSAGDQFKSVSEFKKALNERNEAMSKKVLAEEKLKEAKEFKGSMWDAARSRYHTEDSLKEDIEYYDQTGDVDKLKKAKHMLQRLQERKKKYGEDFGVEAAKKELEAAEKNHKEIDDKINAFQKARGHGAKEENKEYSYGSIEGHQPTGKEKASENESSGSYERLPFYLRSKKDLDPADRKKVQSTVSRFMKEAKEGDVYECGGGFGSAGGQRFRVTRRRGKLALQWINDGYSQPIQMSRGNVEEFIRNGAKLVK